MAAASKDGIESVHVKLAQIPPIYRAGEDLTGKIIVVCGATTPIKAVKLNVFGRMNIYWKKVEGGSTQEFAEIEDYIDEDVPVFVPNPRKKDDQWMFPGTYEYNFNFRLPLDLPETLDSSRYATISYTVKASVYMNLGRKSDSIEEGFYLQAMPDTRIPKVAEEDLPKENCSYATIGGGCFKPTHVELYMSLDKSVYKLGDTIKVHVECSVKGGKADVDKCITLLVQEAVYITNMGFKDEQRKKERLVYAEDVDTEDADVGECQHYDLELKIDENLPLTDFPWCDFIQMGYYIHTVARTAGVYDDIVVKLPIVIGPKEKEAIVSPQDVVMVTENNPEDEGEENEDKNEDESENKDENVDENSDKDENEESKKDDENNDDEDNEEILNNDEGNTEE